MGRLEAQLPPGVESALGRFVANFALLGEYLRGVICEIPKTSDLRVNEFRNQLVAELYDRIRALTSSEPPRTATAFI